MTMTIDQMNLHSTARIPAERLQSKYPFVRFISGRRSLEQQARAMAANVSYDRTWVRNTYRRKDRPSFAIAQEVQAWIDQHPEARSPDNIYVGIIGVMRSIPNAELISFHPAGRAFDFDLWRPHPLVQRIVQREGDKVVLTELGAEVFAFIRTLPNFDAVVNKEGNLIIGHAQFMERQTSTEV